MESSKYFMGEIGRFKGSYIEGPFENEESASFVC